MAALYPTAGCGGQPAPDTAAALGLPWEQIEGRARGQVVRFAMWQGDPLINRYVREWVAPRLLERHGVRLETISAQGSETVAMMMTELEAGRKTSAIDMMWINGENFYQLREIDALAGPFVERLPNARFIDLDDPFIRYDFQQEIEGYECPWGTVQLALIYDTTRTPDPPRTPDELSAWVRENPGRFTFDTGFTGMTFLKSLLIHFAGGPGSMSGAFDEALYEEAWETLRAYLLEVRPHLWRRGESFPAELAQVHQLFASGEVDFTMSNNDGEVDNKVLQGILPESSRAYVLETGTIRNSHYLGISNRSESIEGALVAVNFLISPEAQLEKLDPEVWGDGSVLDLEALPDEWSERFAAMAGRERVPPREVLREHALMEPASEVTIRLHRDFREQVLER